MAKKILAVVLAVMMAVSAMAITAFAEEIVVDLYTQTYDENGLYWDNDISYDTKSTTTTVTFTIPVYALYGYMTTDYYIDFILPNSTLTKAGSKVNWSLIVNGVPYALAAGDGKSTTEIHNYVYFGILGHDYAESGEGENKVVYWATVPQSTTYGDITSVKLVATFAGEITSTDVFDDLTYLAQVYTNDGTDTPVNGSYSFMKSWAGEASTADTVVTGVPFVTADWSTVWTNGDTKYVDGTTTVISYDHNLQNRSRILGAYDGAKLVVELDNALNGQATYTLWVKNPNASVVAGNNWWNYSAARTYVGACYLDGTASTLEFDVPYSALYDANYGVLSEQFIIFENITLFNQTIMTDYLHFDINWWNGSDDNALNMNTNGAGDLGRIGWRWSPVVGFDCPNGWTLNPVRYAAGGVSDALYVANQDAVPAKATSIKLVYTVDDGNTTEVENPQEGTEQDEEGEEVNETPEVTVEEPEDNAPAGDDANPGTGVALAVVPMLVAAAAAVVSKKH